MERSVVVMTGSPWSPLGIGMRGCAFFNAVSAAASLGGREQRVNALIYKRAGALLPKTKVSFQ
mgnify:CR=1 FL=1